MTSRAGFGLLLILPALAGLQLIGCDAGAGRASSRTGFTHVVWQANFDRSRSQCDVQGAGWDAYGGAEYPPCPAAVRIVDIAHEHLPPLGRRHRAIRMAIRRSDARRGVVMPKLFKPFFAPGYADGQQDIHATRPPADVSGSYRAWFYLPRKFRIRGTGWRNIMQFKERFWNGTEAGYHSDPLWWLVLYNPRRRHHARVEAGVRYWAGGNARSVGHARPFPLGRWVEVRADVYQGRRIVWTVDGRHVGTGTPRDYPIGPRHGSESLGWDFGVGNYGGSGRQHAWANRISRPIYVGGALLIR